MNTNTTNATTTFTAEEVRAAIENGSEICGQITLDDDTLFELLQPILEREFGASWLQQLEAYERTDRYGRVCATDYRTALVDHAPASDWAGIAAVFGEWARMSPLSHSED